ncbi:MAG TPA: hypothetical protein VHI13_22080 [Candidatus Kapabacteria bacterium]|nr:hypothetical protein [Candidatus Kapabacteria bacterium]
MAEELSAGNATMVAAFTVQHYDSIAGTIHHTVPAFNPSQRHDLDYPLGHVEDFTARYRTG